MYNTENGYNDFVQGTATQQKCVRKDRCKKPH